MKFLLLLLCVLPLIYAQDVCAQYGTNCTACTTQQGCGWCSTTQQCMSGDTVGPSANGTFCLGPAWQHGVGNCARCEFLRDCRQCSLHPADCGWCDTSSLCHPLSYFRSGLGRCKKVAYCPCENYANCDTCTDGSNCQWCEKEARCQSIFTDCPIGPGYTATTGCPCNMNRDCSSCRTGYNCQWCNNLGCVTKGVEPANGTKCQAPIGDSCDAYCKQQGNSSCNSCNILNGCAWCSSDKACVDSRYPTCTPLAHTCDTCNQHNYCDPCRDNPTCVWCGADQTCRPKSEASSACMPAMSCISVCNAYSSCNGCNGARGCGWCNGKCLDVDKQKCDGLWVHGCEPTPINTPTKCGFDGGSFVGGMFLVIGVIVVGGVGYLFYRWKTGRKILYTELR